jgi:hypothetical protein
VDPARQPLLAHPGLAHHEERAVAAGHPLRQAQELPHPGAPGLEGRPELIFRGPVGAELAEERLSAAADDGVEGLAEASFG